MFTPVQNLLFDDRRFNESFIGYCEETKDTMDSIITVNPAVAKRRRKAAQNQGKPK